MSDTTQNTVIEALGAKYAPTTHHYAVLSRHVADKRIKEGGWVEETVLTRKLPPHGYEEVLVVLSRPKPADPTPKPPTEPPGLVDRVKETIRGRRKF